MANLSNIATESRTSATGTGSAGMTPASFTQHYPADAFVIIVDAADVRGSGQEVRSTAQGIAINTVATLYVRKADGAESIAQVGCNIGAWSGKQQCELAKHVMGTAGHSGLILVGGTSAKQVAATVKGNAKYSTIDILTVAQAHATHPTLKALADAYFKAAK